MSPDYLPFFNATNLHPDIGGLFLNAVLGQHFRGVLDGRALAKLQRAIYYLRDHYRYSSNNT